MVDCFDSGGGVGHRVVVDPVFMSVSTFGLRRDEGKSRRTQLQRAIDAQTFPNHDRIPNLHFTQLFPSWLR